MKIADGLGKTACWFDARGVNGGAGPMASR